MHIDTNVIVHHLTGFPRDRFDAVQRLFAEAATGRIELLLPDAVLLEAGFVLRRVFRLDRKQVAAQLGSLAAMSGVEIEHRDVVLRTLELLENHPLPLIDAYLAASALTRGGPSEEPSEPLVASFDRHFDRIPGLHRISHPDELTR